MKVTKQFLKKHYACKDSYEWFLKQNETDPKKLLKAMIDQNRNLQDVMWVLTRKFTKKQNLQLAVYSAKQVLSIYESYNPNNKAPRKAINAAIKVLENPSKKNRASAYAAADAAAYAAADAAAYAAADAAAHAAYAAAYATANAAARAAYAAYAAARAAADAKLQIKICKYGLKVLLSK